MASYYGDKSRDIPSWDSIEAGDDDDVLDQSEYQFANRDHILFCIDASRSMQKPFLDSDEDGQRVRGKSALHQALEAVVRIERSKVITGPSDSVGVLLYNVDSAKALSAKEQYKPGTYVYQALRTLSAEEIKRIIKLVERAADEYKDQDNDDEKTVQPACLSEQFPPCDKSDEMNVADVLVTCNFLFRDAGTKLAGNKRVFLVTDNDEPPGSSSNREPARTVFGDLTSYGISVNSYFISRPEKHFNATIYWNDILGRSDDETQAVNDEGLSELADIMNEVVIRQAPKRTQFSIPLRFGGKDGDIEIGVSGYALVSVQGKGVPKLVRMRGQTIEEVVTKTEYTSAETGAVLRDSEIGQAFQFGNEATVRNVLERNWWEDDGDAAVQQKYADQAIRLEQDRRRKEDEGEAEGEDVHGDTKAAVKSKDGKPKFVAKTRLQFTDSQIKEFRSMGQPTQIKILGFQSAKNLAVEDNIKHSYFIYPDESTFTGSTRTFSALLKSCLKLNRHALALCRLRANHTPEFAVLIPQAETFTADGGQDDPPGFHVIILPYKDDIRDRPRNMTSNLTATDDQTDIMATIIRRLRFKSGKYRSEAYPNPALGYHHAQLQALAFEEDFGEENFEDKALPKYEGVHKAAGELMAKWNEQIREDDRALEKLVPATKRAAAAEVNGDDLADVEGAYKAGTIEKLKVADLKEYAKAKKISLTGKTKKADIIEALQEHLEKVTSGKKGKSED
ncbi:ATP-dependent DNA helicase II subunit 1 [Cryptotrichosporon argae]